MNKILTFLKHTWSIIIKIWKDPVISSLIATFIVLISPTIWALIKSSSIKEIYQKIVKISIPLYLVIVSILLIFLIIRLILPLLKSKEDKIWNVIIGEYSFKELYSILQNQTLHVQTNGMKMFGRQAPQDDLLTQFCVNKIFLNMGVTMDLEIGDGGYLYGVFCPKMIDYGLVERIEYKDERTKMDMRKYHLTERGNKFYSLIEKINLLKKNNTKG